MILKSLNNQRFQRPTDSSIQSITMDDDQSNSKVWANQKQARKYNSNRDTRKAITNGAKLNRADTRGPWNGGHAQMESVGGIRWTQLVESGGGIRWRNPSVESTLAPTHVINICFNLRSD